jgi:hypothetical protein
MNESDRKIRAIPKIDIGAGHNGPRPTEISGARKPLSPPPPKKPQK